MGTNKAATQALIESLCFSLPWLPVQAFLKVESHLNLVSIHLGTVYNNNKNNIFIVEIGEITQVFEK